MKRNILPLFLLCVLPTVNAQDFSQYKLLPDSAYAADADYRQGNKYQRDAILFVDMLADTHPYYIKPERRDQLMTKRKLLLQKCAVCKSDTAFTSLLHGILGKLRDKHTDLIDTLTFAEKRRQAAQPKKETPDTNANPLFSRHDAPFDYTMLHDESVCYMQFNQCADARTVGDPRLPRFDTFLEEMFHAIDSLHIQTLVVDVRYNSGGRSMLCDELLSYLHPLHKLKHFRPYMRFSRLLASFNPRIAIARQAWEAEGHADELYPMPVGPLPELDRRIYNGKVVFIQGPATYSSAGILLTMARDNNIGVIVGSASTSTFSPSHYGEVLPYRLPNTGVIGSVSCKYFERPDTTRTDDDTLEPTMPIDLQDKDALWQITTAFGKR